MERVLILLVAAFMAYMAPGIQGTAHLSFANNTTQVSNFTRQTCGVTELCVETPDDCDPAGNTTCLFAAINASTPMAPNGTDLTVKLSGESMGYIALGLTVNSSVGNTMLFICAQNSSSNGTFFFRTMQRNNVNTTDAPTPLEKTVTEIRGSVTDNMIRCEFNIPDINATTSRSSHATTFTILLGKGSFDGNTLGVFNVSLDSGPLNLRDPTSNVVNATTAPTGRAPTLAANAVLLLLSVLSLSIML
ncbi:putative ferric-chelate reductase 1 [Scomber japonicus]|uniref:putative ferric-chelate reductase 1 n=1 Tax=Scomber japonicus TaxID=13676 RepID=UPI002306602B|nr:putative ferric-chelate reductase 1 [Scomber japonicus]